MPLPLANSVNPSFDAPGPLRLWNLASLDAPTVAVVWALAFAWAGGVKLPLWIVPLLALTVWAVYVADRLLDARRAWQAGSFARLRERHHFHWRHRRLLVPLAVAAACIAACIVLRFMPVAARERNSLLAAAAVAYFSGVHAGWRVPRLAISKEFLVGMLFTAGCALPAIARAASPGGVPWTLVGVAALYAALAWLNCAAIEGWEGSEGRLCRVAPLAALLGIAALLAATLLAALHPRAALLLVAAAASDLLLALLDRGRTRLTPLALRAAADLVLLTPLLLVPWARLLP